METPILTVGEEGLEEPRPRFEDEFDILAFELWQQGSRPEAAVEDDWADIEEAVGCHASCL